MNKSKNLAFSLFISTSLVSINGIAYNNVHAAGILPNIQSSSYTSIGNIFAKYGYTGQCTWFTYGRTLEKLGIALPSEFYGNAIDWWYTNIRDNVYAYGSEPRDNSIAVWSGGSAGYGHVGFVEKVDGNNVYLNEGNFNVRGGYDGNVKVLSKVQMQNRGNVFLKGYIYVGSGKTSIPASSSSSETSINKSGVVSLANPSSNLNIRDGAGSSFEVIGSLKNSQSVQVVGVVGSWYKIKINSSYGYVSSDYIKLGSVLSPDKVSQGSGSGDTSNNTSSKTGYVKLQNSSSVLNLRNSPNGAIIGFLSNNTKLSIIGTSGNWYKVTANGKTGYVSSNYVSSESSVSTAVNSSKVGTVSLSTAASTLNLRTSPWTGAVITSLKNGTKVTILGSSGNWYKVSIGSTTGYVYSDYIK